MGRQSKKFNSRLWQSRLNQTFPLHRQELILEVISFRLYRQLPSLHFCKTDHDSP